MLLLSRPLIFLVPHIARTVLLRCLLIWLVIRAVASSASYAISAPFEGESPLHPLFLSPLSALLIAGLVAGGGWAYARRFHEDAFLRCLGYATTDLLALFLLPWLLIELALGIAVRL